MSSHISEAAAQVEQIATAWIEQIEGCTLDDTHHQWVQEYPGPQTLVIHVKAVNFTKQPISYASIGVFWPYENLAWRYSGELVSLDTTQSLEAKFQLEPLRDGDHSALYFALFENSLLGQKSNTPPTELLGTAQALIIHTSALWKALHTKI